LTAPPIGVFWLRACIELRQSSHRLLLSTIVFKLTRSSLKRLRMEIELVFSFWVIILLSSSNLRPTGL